MAEAKRPLPTFPSCVRVREGDEPFLVGILKSRNRDEWTDADLVVAVQLARAQADIEKESYDLEIEGSVLTNDRGTRVMNPRHTVLEQLARREMAMMKSLSMLGVVARATKNKEDLANSRSLQRKAGAINDEDDGLLA